MSDDLDEMGPIDYLVVEFPGSRMTGEGLPLLVDLVDRGIIRILDLVFVKKDLDGSVDGLAIADLDGDGALDLAVFEGASSGLLGRGRHRGGRRRARAGQLGGNPGLRELWAAPFAAALRRGGGQLVASGRIPVQALLAPWTQLEPRQPRDEPTEPRGKERTMPGLIRGVARTAVVAGTATAVSNRVSRRQAGRWAEQEQQEPSSSTRAAAARAAPRPARDAWTPSSPSSRSSAS